MKIKLLSLILVIGIVLFILSGCDSGFLTTDIAIAKYPDRITYILGKDTVLDLLGLEIEVTTKSGYKDIVSLDDDSFYRDAFIVNENIDFNKKGVYVVEISTSSDINCSFAIEVIDLDDFK